MILNLVWHSDLNIQCLKFTPVKSIIIYTLFEQSNIMWLIYINMDESTLQANVNPED